VIHSAAGFDPVSVVDVLEREQITNCFFVPSQWQAICAVPGVKDRRLALRNLVWGASPAPPSVLQALQDTFPDAPAYCAFGQTEMSPTTTLLRSEDAVRKMGSVGTPLPSIELRIVDEEMRDVPVGEVGEVVYRGPTMMLGYWNKPEETEAAFAGGWFHSGDLCRMDDEGYIYVVDRKKDMIISGGENIYCAEVENALAGHPAIVEVAVIGRPDPKWGEVPVAVVALGAVSDKTVELADLVEFLTERLARYKHPKALEIVDALPRNPAGKVLKTELRARFGAQKLIDAGESSTPPTVSAAAQDN
jgi:fatty-acyl-CoA synthase